MKLILALLAMTLSVGSTMAAPLVFTGFLTGPKEEPPNASSGTGTTTVTIDPTAHTLRVQVTFQGLTSPNTASHIHIINGPGDTNTLDTLGPVATTTPTFTGFPSGVTAGTFDGTFDTTQASTYRPGFLTDAGGTTAAAEAALFAGIIGGRSYLNIHTTVNTGGEIRDFLQPVPEPATIGILAVVLGGVVAMHRKRCVASA